MLARFLVANPKALIPKRVKGYCHLSEKLPHLYNWLENCPMGIVKLSSAADTYYTKLCENIGRQAWETSQPAIRAWMFKLPTQVLRIALALHLIECYHDSRDFWLIQKDTLERAVLFAQYYRSAFNVLQETTAESDDISSILLKIWDTAITKHQDGISTRDAYRGIKAIQNRAKEAFRDVCAYTTELFGRLEQMGKGRVVKSGRQIKFVANLTANNPPPTTPSLELSHSSDSVSIPENQQIQAIEVSPPIDVSPVTIDFGNPGNGYCLGSEDVQLGTGDRENSVVDSDPTLVETTSFAQVNSEITHLADNNQNHFPVIDSVETVTPTPEITKGAKVRVCFPGSYRHEKEGIVTKLLHEHGIKKAVVLLENIDSKLRQFLCPIPGSDLMHLELI